MFSRLCPSSSRRIAARSFGSVNVIASEGFGGAQADRYQASRPAYSADCVKTVSEIVAGDSYGAYKSKPMRLLEIAAGTGKFTHSFIKDSPLRGDTSVKIEYIATEPSDGFLAKLRGVVAAEKSPWRVTATAGTAESIPVDDRSVDAIIVAQAFHWFSKIESLEAFHRALKPGKALILVWNFFDTDVEWIRELEHGLVTPVYDKMESASGDIVPRYINGRWREVFDTHRAKQLFSPLSSSSSTIVHRCDANTIVDRILSVSVVARLPQEEQAEMARRVRELLRTHSQTRGAATFDLQYKTSVRWAHAL